MSDRPTPPNDRRQNHYLRDLIAEYVRNDGLAERFAARADVTLHRVRQVSRRIRERVLLAARTHRNQSVRSPENVLTLGEQPNCSPGGSSATAVPVKAPTEDC